MKKYMLSHRFSFEAHAKNLWEKASKCSWNTINITKILLDTDGHVLSKFDIYQGKVVPNCFKGHAKSWCPQFFQEKSFASDIRSEIHLVRHNIVSTGQFARPWTPSWAFFMSFEHKRRISILINSSWRLLQHKSSKKLS